MGTANSDLSRLNMLVIAINDTLKGAVRATDSERKSIINCAFCDAKRAQNFWLDGRVVGLGNSRIAMAEVVSRLADASRVKKPLERAELLNVAHKRVVVVLGEIKSCLARCGQEGVTNAC